MGEYSKLKFLLVIKRSSCPIILATKSLFLNPACLCDFSEIQLHSIELSDFPMLLVMFLGGTYGSNLSCIPPNPHGF
jgi:hypothetical protein